MNDKSPSATLTKPARPLLTAAIIGGIVVAVAGAGSAAFAIAQAASGSNDQVQVLETNAPASEPTPTEEPNVAPVADYIVTAFDGLTLTFDAGTSSDTDGAISDYAWDFGDGSSGSGVAVVHTFAASGNYPITVTVTDDLGSSDSFVAAIDVTAPPAAPPAGTSGCPAGSFVAQGGPGVELLCMWNICTTLTLPDASHPECDAAFRP